MKIVDRCFMCGKLHYTYPIMIIFHRIKCRIRHEACPEFKKSICNECLRSLVEYTLQYEKETKNERI